jgi:transcription initiation factor TFIIIB Brf1 subunit/transcription initiation factor TFIIB
MLKLEKKPKSCYFNPKIYALDYARKLRFSSNSKHFVEKLSDAIMAKRLNLGRDPRVIAAIICYMASIMSGKSRSQRDIAEMAGVTEPSVGRGRGYRWIANKLGIDLDDPRSLDCFMSGELGT